MNVTNPSLATLAMTSLAALSASAVPITLLEDDFESFPAMAIQARGMSLDPNGGTNIGIGNTYTDVEAQAVNAASGWRDISAVPASVTASGSDSFNSNARWDQDGNGGGVGMRVRANTGAATLDAPLQLASLGVVSVTFEYDALLDINDDYGVVIQYSDGADFSTSNLVTLATLTSPDGGGDGSWLEDQSVTIEDGVGGINFTDDAYFVIRRDPGFAGGVANSTFHTFDNISITAEVPEPSSLALLALGGLFMSRRRRN